jgi:Fe-S cluster assembly iron-binding protein IscA
MQGSTIDYEVDLIRANFQVIDNPNVDDGCGCGVSFNAPDNLFK